MSFQISTNFNVPTNPAMFFVNQPQLVNVPQYSFVQVPQYAPVIGCTGVNTFPQQSVVLDAVSFQNLFGFCPEGTWVESSMNVRMTFENNVFHCNGIIVSTFQLESGNVTMTLEGTKYMVRPRVENGSAILDMQSSRSQLCWVKEPQVNFVQTQQMIAFPPPINQQSPSYPSPSHFQPSPTHVQSSPAYFESPSYSPEHYSSCSSEGSASPTYTDMAQDEDSMDCSESISDYSLDLDTSDHSDPGSDHDTQSLRSNSTVSESGSVMEIERERGRLTMFENIFFQQTDKSTNKQDLIADQIPKAMAFLLSLCPVNDLRGDMSTAQREQLLRELSSGNAEREKKAQEEISNISSWHEFELVYGPDNKPIQEFTMKGNKRELKYTKEGEPVYEKTVKLSNALREEPLDLKKGDRTIVHFRAKNKKAIAALVPFLTCLIHEHGILPQKFTALPAFNSSNSRNKKDTYKGLLVYIKFTKEDVRRIANIQRDEFFAGERWCDLVPGLVQQCPAEAGSSRGKGYQSLVEAFFGN